MYIENQKFNCNRNKTASLVLIYYFCGCYGQYECRLIWAIVGEKDNSTIRD